MLSSTLESIRTLLDEAGVDYDLARHAAVSTAEDAAAARGCSVDIGAKSIVLKTDDEFRLFVLSGSAAVLSSAIRRHLGVRRTRFATADELLALTGVRPGAVPPFGEPILPLPLFVDPGLLEHERIAFTPGDHTVSIIMQSDDYREGVSCPKCVHETDDDKRSRLEERRRQVVLAAERGESHIGPKKQDNI